MTSEKPPSKDGRLSREASLPLASSFTIFLGVIIVVLGISFYGTVFSGGGLSLNSSGQGGLLLTITSLNVLALGSIVGLQLRRTWTLIIIGIVFAALGIIAVISPGGVVAGVNTLLIGVSNIITGVLTVAGTLAAARQGPSSPPAELVSVLPLLKRVFFIGLIIGIVSIVFGLSMLAPTLLPSILGLLGFALIFPPILIIMGLLLLYMTRINLKLQQMS
ncbi:MAG: hypothetical protein WCE81_07290 [Halobacteriota archaeon]